MTHFKLYNAFNDAIEPVALEREPVSVYVCGITPYDTTHLGHAFTYAVADHLIRFLEFLGRPVTYVQNVTDIDDDILRKAKEVGEDWRTLGNRWTTHFLEDLQRLNVRPPDHYPRASDFIPQMIRGIERLLNKEMAYVAGGSVYYYAQRWPAFGALSGLEPHELLPTANEQGNIAEDPNKRDALDFPLWQAQKPGEPAWESPWGPGRPGWHIECSTMAIELLGDSVDFHGGGSDLAFPHHECEIAQAEPVTGVSPFVRSWFHAGMVEYEGEKMSKSLGNLVMARDLLEDFSPDALRLYLACHHYRKPWGYDREQLQASAERAGRWQAAVATNKEPDDAPSEGPDKQRHASALSQELTQRFTDALANDLDTPSAIRVLDEAAAQIANFSQAGNDVQAAQVTFRRLVGVLGLQLTAAGPDPSVFQGWNTHMAAFAR